MPPRDGAPQVIRIVEGLCGEVEMVSAMRPRPGYGSVSPWIHEVGGRMVAEAGADALWLDTCVPQVEKDGVVVSAFAIGAGQSVAFVLSWCPSHAAAPEVPDPEAALAETLAFWQDWTQECTYDGPYREAVVRSSIALKAMIGDQGGVVAAGTENPTSSQNRVGEVMGTQGTPKQLWPQASGFAAGSGSSGGWRVSGAGSGRMLGYYHDL